MRHFQRSPFILYAGLLIGGLALWLFLQLRSPNIPRPPGSHSALAPNGQSTTPLPVAAASLRGGQTTISRASVAPDTPGSLNNLPPPPPHERFGEKEEEHADEEHIESNLTEAEYEEAIEHARDLPPDPSLAPGVGFLATGPTLGTNFNGLDVTDCCGSPGNFFAWPPDPDMAVGANHILVAVNSAFAVYNKSGVKQGSAINAYSFWSTAGGVCGTIANDPHGNIFDPFVAYDPGEDRFIVGFDAISNDGSTRQSYVCLAISPVGNPTAAAGAWYRYSINVKKTISGSDYWLDYPHISVWYNGIYVTGNYFRFSDNAWLYSSIYALDKADLYTNSPADIRNVEDIRDAYGYTIFTVQPVKATYTYPGSGPAYFLNNDCLIAVSGPCDGAELNVYKLAVDFVGSGTSFVLASHLALTDYSYPVSAPQLGTTAKVQANDERLLDAQWHTNGTIYTTHTMGCNPGAGTVDCIRWYQVGNLSGTPTLLQEGTISNLATEYRFFPDLAVDRSGNMAIAYSYSSSLAYVGIRFTGRLADEAEGTTASDSIFKVGEDVYSNNFASSPHRWGDYTAMVVDPVDGCTLWYVGEFSKTRVYGSGPNWGTRIGQLYFNRCLTLTVNPVSVMENALNPAATGMVSRFSAEASPLTVNISSSLPLTVTVPTTVTIPASQASTTFPVSVVDNAAPGTTFLNATITVTATNYLTGTAPLLVLDDETVKQFFLPVMRR